MELVKLFPKQILAFLLFAGFVVYCKASSQREYNFVREAPYTRLCHTKKILTVNGQFPGPTLYAHKGEKLIVNVINRGNYNITIHCNQDIHGRMVRNISHNVQLNPEVIFSAEEGTLWWHAHSDWSRATVHGAIVVLPKKGTTYPFQKPYAEVPIVLAEWWKKDVMEVFEEFMATGGDPNVSDAFTINGQPGDLYPCSKQDTYKLTVQQGKTYLLRFVNAAMNIILFLGIHKHNLTVVGSDAAYTKQLTRDYIVIAPGQTIDALLRADQPGGRYYLAARAYSSPKNLSFDNTTTTAIIEYTNVGGATKNVSSTQKEPYLTLPFLPYYNDTLAATNFSGSLRSLNDKDHPSEVPLEISTKLVSTLSINTLPCLNVNDSCEGPNGTRLAASMNNISFVNPKIDILQAYYYNIKGVFGKKFPKFPPLVFNFTADYLPLVYELPKRKTEVIVLKYNATVEMVLQGTNVVTGIDHPMHLHGFSFYVVGWGFGNYDKFKDPQGYNLVDPPLRNTIMVPKNGWTAIRFKAANPGVWFMHCHFERHMTWGMETVFIVKDGKGRNARMRRPPADMPPC
ncbi:Multicopper oxidase, C-terminal [Dillenia turbinata]|uniref:Laccase n=1 Tax=Dillenia turbinata TaxID=194707 RepID=A0AAN8ZN73_9MAGN